MNKIKILIADDSLFMAKILMKNLKNSFYEIVGYAANGEEAIILYKKYLPDLVFMDITMPKIDGVNALKEILSIDKNAYIIMCSAMGQDVIIDNCLKIGAKSFITKPFNPLKIKEEVIKCFIKKSREKK